MLATGPTYQYFRIIENEFIRLRVTPLLFSPDDYRIAKGWFEAGIPLDVVLATLTQVVERQRERQQDVRRRLSYYRAAVEKAWEVRSDLAAGGSVDKIDGLETEVALETLASALACYPEIASAVRQLRGKPDIEKNLRRLEPKLLEAALASLDEDRRAKIDSEWESAVRSLSGRLSGKPLEKASKGLLEQITRRHLALPRLTLGWVATPAG